MNKKVLIIGGTGFLGYNLAKKLLLHKFNITLLCKKKKRKILKLKKTKYLYCNLENFQNENFDIVINFSGNIDHQNKEQTFKTHYGGTKIYFIY